MLVATVHKASLRKGLLLMAVLVAGVSLLWWPQAVSGGIDRGMSICYTVIIPSLFPFLVLAGFVTRSGIDAVVGRRLERVTRCLFRLPGRCATGILIGMVGGYPAGGAAVGELLRNGVITRREGQRMMLFCVNAGPAFILSTVGAGLMGDVRAGILLLTAHLAVALIIGFAGRWLYKPEPAVASVPPAETALPPSAALAGSVNAACRSMLYMCGFVILFAALQALCDASGLSEQLTDLLAWLFRAAGLSTQGADCILPLLTEVTGGCVAASAAGEYRPFLLGMALGWGGLSVHCQLTATLHEYRVMGRSFRLARLCHAVLGGALSALLFRFVPLPQATAHSLSGISFTATASSAPAAVTLLAMCVLLLFTNSHTTASDKAK